METIYKIAVALPPGVSSCDEFTQPWSRYSAITQKKQKHQKQSPQPASWHRYPFDMENPFKRLSTRF